MTAFVFLPWVASISDRVPRTLCTMRLTGAASGLTTATIFCELTTFPNPMLISFANFFPLFLLGAVFFCIFAFLVLKSGG